VENSPIGSAAQELSAEAQRRDERDSLMVLAHLRLEGADEPDTVRVRNVSSGGLMAQASDAYRPGARVAVEIENVGAVGGIVAWAEAGRIGIAFDHPIDKARARKPLVSKDDPRIYRHVADPRRPALKPR
jgi:hypothetical protein